MTCMPAALCPKEGTHLCAHPKHDHSCPCYSHLGASLQRLQPGGGCSHPCHLAGCCTEDARAGPGGARRTHQHRARWVAGWAVLHPVWAW